MQWCIFGSHGDVDDLLKIVLSDFDKYVIDRKLQQTGAFIYV